MHICFLFAANINGFACATTQLGKETLSQILKGYYFLSYLLFSVGKH